MHSRQAATQPGPMGLLQVEPPAGSAARLPMHAMTASYKRWIWLCKMTLTSRHAIEGAHRQARCNGGVQHP